VFFDRRLWHSASPNHSNITRKVLFYGYSYRWLRPRDNMTVDRYIERSDPIRRQLLGASTGGLGYTSPSDEDVPLRDWIKAHLGEEAVVP
jgi:ectoine hydroxylase-related dioxygenase (phytanoyl-CoA dioxygenase family)